MWGEGSVRRIKARIHEIQFSISCKISMQRKKEFAEFEPMITEFEVYIFKVTTSIREGTDILQVHGIDILCTGI